MGGLRRYMPWTAGLMWVATLAIAGVPGLSGFFSKDEILAATFERGQLAPYFYVLWGIGTIAALLTAFYMTRMMLYTFHGPNRSGEHAGEHLHEAPWVMTGPLLVLGIGTVLAGLLNLPAILPGSGWLERHLEPVTATSGYYLADAHLGVGTEWALLGFATLVAAIGIVGAWRILHPGTLPPARSAAPETGIQRVLAHKFYVDEIYDTIIVHPLIWFSNRILWRTVDATIVDGLAVNGVARFSRFAGWVGSRLQTGSVGAYVVIFVIGVLAVIFGLRG
jgi:NADH-quinone oxidoreductase subunit L